MSRSLHFALKTLKWGSLSSLLILVLMLSGMGLGLLWLGQNYARSNPMDLMPYVPRIQQFLEKRGLNVQVSSLQLYYDDSPVIRAEGLRVLGPDGSLAVYAEAAGIKLANGRLMRFAISPKIIEAKNVTLRLVRGADQKVSIAGLTLASDTPAPEDSGLVEWLDNLPSDSLWGRLKHVRVQGVTLLLRDDIQKAEWVLEEGSLGADRYEGRGERGSLIGYIRRLNQTILGKKPQPPTPVLVTLERQPEADIVNVEAKLGEINAAIIKDYLPPVVQDLVQAQGTLAVGSVLSRGNRLGLPWLTLHLKQAKLNLPADAGYSKPIIFPQMDATVSYHPSPTDRLDIKTLSVMLPKGNLIVVSGSVISLTTDPTLALSAFSPGGEVRSFADFIPDQKPKVRKTYEWLHTRLKDTLYKNMTADVGLRLKAFPGCGDECGRLDINMEIISGTAKFSDDFPVANIVPVRGQPASFFWRRQTLGVIAPKGKLEEQALGSVWVTLDNLFTPSPSTLVVSGSVVGPLNNVMDILRAVPELKGKIPGTYSGTQKSVMQLSVPLVKQVSPTFASSTLVLNGAVKDVVLSDFEALKTHKLAAPLATVQLMADKTLKITAPKATLGTDPVGLIWQQNLQPHQPSAIHLAISGTLGMATLTPYLPADVLKMDGSLGLDAKIHETAPHVWAFEGSVYATRPSIGLPLLSYRKAAGEPLNAKAKGVWEEDKVLRLSTLQAKGAGVDISGSLTLPEAGFETGEASFPQFKMGLTDVAVTLAKNTLTLKGNALDLRGLKLFDGTEKKQSVQNLGLNVQVGMLKFGQGDLSGANLQAEARKGSWNLDKVYGSVDGGGVVNIRRNGKNMDINIDNLGRTLEVFGLYDKLKGGRTFGSLRGTGGGRYQGEVKMLDFELRNPPTMVKLLGLMSLEQLLAGSDTTKFSKASIPITLTPEAVTLNEARFTGPSMDMRLRGNYWRLDEVLDIKGSLAPAIPFNRLVTKIPLLGTLLSGSQDGVVVADFRITGKTADPQISVQPLSVLTPGLLKDLFR